MRGQKVAGWLHGQLSLRFCRESFNSGDFFRAIFSPVASPVQGWLHVRFSSRAGDVTKFEKIASPALAKNRSCSRGFKVANNFEQTTKKLSKVLKISFSFKGLCHVILGCLVEIS